MKVCNCCKEKKEFNQFYKSQYTDGYRPSCKKCIIDKQKKYYKLTYQVKPKKQLKTKQEQLEYKKIWMRNYRRKKVGMTV